MSTSFPLDALDEIPFARRLRALLDEACRKLGLGAAAVADLAAVDGRVAPLWRGWSPAAAAPGAPPPDAFRSLADRDGARAAGDGDVDALGPPFAGRAATVMALPVSPRLARAPDAVAIFAHGRTAPDAEALAGLGACLARGLSADRRARIGQVMLAAVDQAPDAIELTDREARLLYANASWHATFGYTPGDPLGSTMAQLFRDPVAPVHDTAFYQFTMSTLGTGRPWLGALARRSRDGGRVFREVNVAPFTADEPGFRGNIAILRSIAHREERDAALAVAHSQFRSVLSAIPDGVAVVRDGSIYFANTAFLTMCQLTEEQAIGFPYVHLIHGDDRERFQAEHRQGVARVRVVGRNGAARFAEISSAGAVSFEGQTSTILLSRDTTDHYLAQQRLAHAEKLSALGSLAAGVAHEVNNPLAFLILNLELLHKNAESAGSADDLEAIDEAIGGAKRIRSIVAELRSFARPASPGLPDLVDVEKAATSAVNIASNEIRHRARLVRQHDEGLCVMADEGQLVQVLVNVLVNAAQSIPSSIPGDHTVGITSRRVGGDVEIVIADSGVGIPASALPHVFEPFFTSKPRGQGSGLGLAISKQIVDSFGGRIGIESEPNVGTTVRITLPAAAAVRTSVVVGVNPMTPPAGIPARREPIARPVARVLIVDDELPMARGLRRSLPEHDVAVAKDGAEALHVIEASAPGFFDLVLCDLMMPGLSGADVYRKAIVVHPELTGRFVFMTGAAPAGGFVALPEGAGGRLLEKPFDVERLRTWVDAAVAERSSENHGQHHPRGRGGRP